MDRSVTPKTGLDDDGYPVGLDTEQRAFQRRYGPWQPWDPARASEVFDPLGIPWWVAGGWAIEAFTGVHREHEDIDVAMFRRDLPTLRSALEGRLHVWAAEDGSLTPMGTRRPMPDTADQVWLRAHALSPWVADVLLNPDDDGRWVFRRDRGLVADLEAVTWSKDGVRYLDPEVVLAFKAKRTRPKDEVDFTETLPLLETPARAWLADFLARIHPDHAWLARV